MQRVFAVFIVTLIVTPLADCTEPSATPSQIISHIPRQPVQSSAIAKIGYSKRRHMLEIEFVNGAVYRLSRRAGCGLSRPDVRGIKGALLRFKHQGTLSFGRGSVVAKGAGIHEIN